MNLASSNPLDLAKAQLDLGSLGSLKAKAEGLGAAGGKFSEADQKRWKASLDFEAMFLGQMYKAMRQSVSASDLTEKSPGREIFTEMLDQEFAGQKSKSPQASGPMGLLNAMNGASSGLAAQIYRSLSRQNQDIVPQVSLPKSALQQMQSLGAGEDGEFPSEGLMLSSMLQARARMAKRGSAGKTLSDAALEPLVDMAAGAYQVSKNLIRSVIKAESGDQPQAVSRVGAKGLMQIMDSTAADLGLRDAYNPRENVLAGTRYLKEMLVRFHGDEKLALAAYNAGPGTVEKYQGVPPIEETQKYVEKVLQLKGELDAAEKGE